jgi:hypothetical protein
MKFLIPEDELGVFADQRGVPRVDSLFVQLILLKNSIITCCVISDESLHPILD